MLYFESLKNNWEMGKEKKYLLVYTLLFGWRNNFGETNFNFGRKRGLNTAQTKFLSLIRGTNFCRAKWGRVLIFQAVVYNPVANRHI
jgi:hypothetical protein